MFFKAIPVWGDYLNHIDKLNRHLIFRETIESLDHVTVNIAASDFYRLTVNGEFVGFGPARTAGGFARVDSYDLSGIKSADNKKNEIVIEVAGYHCKSMSTVLGESFFCAEITEAGTVKKYTGRDFDCFENTRRVRKVERYSVQRHFGEIYDDNLATKRAVQVVPVAHDITFIPRRVPFASCVVSDIYKYMSRGVFVETDDGRIHSREFGTGKSKTLTAFLLRKSRNTGLFLPRKSRISRIAM